MQNRDEINDFKYNLPLFFLSTKINFLKVVASPQPVLPDNSIVYWKTLMKNAPQIFFSLFIRLEFPKLKDTTLDG